MKPFTGLTINFVWYNNTLSNDITALGQWSPADFFQSLRGLRQGNLLLLCCFWLLWRFSIGCWRKSRMPAYFMVSRLMVKGWRGMCFASSFFFFLISNKVYWYQKRDTLVHRECTGVNKSSTKIKKIKKRRKWLVSQSRQLIQ